MTGLTRSGAGCFRAVYPYGNSGRQRVITNMRQDDVNKQLFLDSGGETVLISLNPVVYELNENVGKFQRVVSNA